LFSFCHPPPFKLAVKCVHSNDSSWNRVDPVFLKTYRPKECRETNEFWLTYFDFCHHFDDVIVSSSTEPSSTLHLDSERRFPDDTATTTATEPVGVDAMALSTNGCSSEPTRCRAGEQGASESVRCRGRDKSVFESTRCKGGSGEQWENTTREQPVSEATGRRGGDEVFITLSDLPRRKTTGGIEVTVREDRSTVKVDTIEKYKPDADVTDAAFGAHVFTAAEKKAVVACLSQKPKTGRDVSSKVKDDMFLVRTPLSFATKSGDNATSTVPVCRQNSGASSGRGSNHSSYSLFAAAGNTTRGATRGFYVNYEQATSVASDLSVLSTASNHSSRAGSMSDISIKVRHYIQRHLVPSHVRIVVALTASLPSWFHNFHLSLFLTALWESANYRRVRSLALSPNLYFRLPCLLPSLW